MGTSTLIARLRHVDLYAILEVEADASEDAIRRAYRRGALKSHPDRQPGDREAAKRFLLLTEARDVLLNPAARSAYDQMRDRMLGAGERVGAESTRAGKRPVRRSQASDPLNEQRMAARAQASRSAVELTALWRAGTTVVRAAVLRNVNCPIHIFQDPCVVEHWMLGLEAAHRAACPVAVLEKLSFSFERSVAMAVVLHPATSTAALATVAGRHRDLGILSAIATHQNARADVLRVLSRAVRGPRTAALGAAILSHAECPQDVAQHIRTRLGNMVA